MIMNKQLIEEAFDFYNINSKYKNRCYEVLKNITQNERFKKSFEKVYKLLYIEDFKKMKTLWEFYDINQLFSTSISPFVTNLMILSGYLMILSGYEIHKKNIKKYKLEDSQISIHKKRVKECFESDLINREYNGVRISQMIWSAYFVRARIIEVGSLQYEYVSASIIKIHIPKNTNLSSVKVKESLIKSKIELKKVFNVEHCKYICHSWLLSKQIYSIVDKNTNIAKFSDLFEITEGENCVKDILDYVYGTQKCDDYCLLEEKTSLQKAIKQKLINNNPFYLGKGVLK